MITSEELIERCKRGDSSGYTGLYHAHSKVVYNTIYRLLSHTAEAEDVLQETFVSAFQSIHQFKNEGAFRSWIKRIAINKAINLIRKRKLKWVELESEEGVIDEEEMVDEDEFEYKMDSIAKAIELLPPTYRTVFQLYAVENIPQVEIAQMLGVSNNVVRTQYFRAKNKLLSTLKETYHEN